MSKIRSRLERLTDKFMPEGVSFSELKIERLWISVIFLSAFFASLFVLLDAFVVVGPAATLCATVTAASPLYLWLFKKGYRAGSKLFLHLHVIVALFIITIIYTEEGYAWTFMIPVLMSSLLIFTPRQRVHSIIIVALTFAFLPTYLAIRHLFPPMEFNEASMHSFKILNLTGSLSFCAIILKTINGANELIQHQLTRQIEENARQNKIMLGSIRTRDKLLSMMSHDVRGDIGKTIGVVDVIQQMDLGKEDQATLLNNLKIDAVKTLETLDNMLQWTRTQQDELNIHLQPCEVDRLISQLLSNHDFAINTKRINIRLNVPGRLVISADRNMIDSILRNLLGNAIKFTPIGGIISISVKQHENMIEFSVQDSGVGMSAEQIDNIVKGVQFTTRGTNREKGRGFGMVLVNDFLAKHKSALHIESTIGKGTRFSFSLPTHTTT